MRRPRRRVIGIGGEMVAGVDVKIFGGHDVVVTGLSGQIVVDCPGNGMPTGNGQRTALAEVFLHVDDDQRSHAVTLSPSDTCW